jgi:hypothetical protein
LLIVKTESALYDYGTNSTDKGGTISVLTPMGLRESPRTFSTDNENHVGYTGDPGRIRLGDNETATVTFAHNAVMLLVSDGSGFGALMTFSYKQALASIGDGVVHNNGLTISLTDDNAGWQCTKAVDSRAIVFTNRTGNEANLNISSFGGRIHSLVIS